MRIVALILLGVLGCGGARVSDAAAEPVPQATPATPQAPGTPSQAPTTAPADDVAADPVLAAADEAYAGLLAAIVDDGGLVRYEKLAEREHRAALNAVVRGYQNATLPMKREDRIAFFCNAYNANVLQRAFQASRRKGFENVEKISGFLDQAAIHVAGNKLTLNDLENGQIRRARDPRIHAALVCAAMSCPPLRNEPYRGEKLNEQLDDQCRRWINDAQRNGVVDERISVSRIFDWYGADFNVPPHGSLAAFLRHYADPAGDLGRALAGDEKPAIRFREYDWTLNQAR